MNSKDLGLEIRPCPKCSVETFWVCNDCQECPRCHAPEGEDWLKSVCQVLLGRMENETISGFIQILQTIARMTEDGSLVAQGLLKEYSESAGALVTISTEDRVSGKGRTYEEAFYRFAELMNYDKKQIEQGLEEARKLDFEMGMKAALGELFGDLNIDASDHIRGRPTTPNMPLN
jgi:hypothetical protein